MLIKKTSAVLTACALSISISLIPSGQAEAGGALKGAVIGAGVGGLVDGKDGAVKGAVAGGVAGAILGD
ncbi:hypothetical protein [Roseobacter sp.]|uniref:hypothetical protein n=1 Tax=Roseobacter sp. TaxID=1907202 RepID=UPI00385CF893